MTRGLRVLAAALLVLGAGVLGAPRAHAQDRVLVLGPDGRPLDGVVVHRASARRGDVPLFPAEGEGVQVALERGLLQGAALPDDGAVLWRPGLAATSLERAGGAVRLLEARPLAGRIRFADGTPAAERAVVAFPTHRGGVAHRTVTDAEGSYRFGLLAPGAWELQVERAAGRWQPLGSFEAGDGAGELVVRGGGAVRGQVHDADRPGVVPFPDLALLLVPRVADEEGGREPIAFSTDAAGAFFLTDVPAGIWEARPAEGSGVVLSDPPPRVQITTGIATVFRTFAAWRRVAVTGRIVDPEGSGIPDAEVALLLAAGQDVPGDVGVLPAARTDPEGRFRLEGVRPGLSYRLAAAAEGRAPLLIDAFRVGHGARDLAPVTLGRGWTLEVRTWGEGGVRSGGIDVVAVPATRPEPFRRAFGPYRATTNAEGVARIGNLPLDDLRVTAGGGRTIPIQDVVRRPSSADVVVHNFRMVPAPDLEGVVEGDGGRRLPALRVRAVPADGDGGPEVDVGPAGRFRFEGLAAVPTDLEVVRAAAPEDVPLAVYPRALPGSGETVRILVPRLFLVEGRAVDLEADGPPAEVRLEAPVLDADRRASTWTTVRRLALPEGRVAPRWSFADVPPGPYAVRVVQGLRDGGPTPVWVEDADVGGLTLALPVGAGLAGTVLGPRNLPVMGAVVRLERLRGDGDRPGTLAEAPLQATDADGAFAFPAVAPGLWRVVAEDGHLAPDLEVVRVREGENLVLRDLVLGQGGAIEGRVYDGAGRALDGAWLELESVREGPPSRRIETREDGTFAEDAIVPGTYRITLRSEAGMFTDTAVLVEVVANETSEVVLTPAGRAEIEGRVRRGGRAVADASVRLIGFAADVDDALRQFETRTDPAGRFTWRDLPAGRYALDVYDGVVRTRRRLFLQDADRALVDVDLFEARIEGRVVSTRGRPIRDAWVRAVPVEGAAETDVVGARVRTRPDGRFVLAGLPRGRYDLVVFAPGLPPGRLAGAVADTGRVADAVEVVIGRGGTIELRVADDAGRGVPAAAVWLETEDGVPLAARPYTPTGSGRLRLVGVPEGRWWLRVDARGFGTPPRRAVDVREGGVRDVEVVLPPAASLLVVVGSDGVQVPPARVTLFAEADPGLSVGGGVVHPDGLGPAPGRVGRTGRLLLRDLAPGRYRLRVEAGTRFEGVEVPVAIVEGEPHEVEVVLPFADR